MIDKILPCAFHFFYKKEDFIAVFTKKQTQNKNDLLNANLFLFLGQPVNVILWTTF